MGGKASRLLQEIARDALEIAQQTNRSIYERTVQERTQLQNQIKQLKSTQTDEISNETRRILQLFSNLQAQKQHLDQATDKFTDQFAASADLHAKIKRNKLSHANHSDTFERYEEKIK